jgi:hypothetical protein
LPYSPEVEKAVKELIDIKKQNPRVTSPALKKRVKELLTFLKRLYQLTEIQEMTHGLWPVAASKPYVPGIKTGEGSNAERGINLGIIGDLEKNNLTLEQVKLANSIHKTLDSDGVKLEDVSELIRQSTNAGMSIQLFVSYVKEIKQSGIPIGEFGEAYRYRKSLESMNVNSNTLGLLVDAIAKQGRDIGKTIEAVNILGDLNARKAEVAKQTEVSKALEKHVATVQLDIKELEGKKKAAREELNLLQQLQEKGFDKEVLNKIAESGQKYGGPKQVIEAINQFDNLYMMNKKTEDAEKKADLAQTNLSKVQAEHTHLTPLIEMSKELLKRGFTIEAVHQITDVAKQYGEPTEVFKALAEYQKIVRLQQDVKNLSKSKTSLEAENNQMSISLSVLNAQLIAIDGQIKRVTSSMSTELNNALKRGADNIASAIASEGQRLREAVDEYARQAKEAGILEDELELLKVIHAVTKYPDAMHPVSTKYALLFLDLAARILETLGSNPRIKGTSIAGALDAINMARRELNPLS